MLIQRRHANALGTLVLLTLVVASVCGINDYAWQDFEPAKDKYVKQDVLESVPSTYQFRNCEFVVPGSIDYSTGKPVPIQQVEGSTADGVRGHLFMASSIVATVAVGFDLAKTVFSLTSAVVSGIPIVGSALSAFLGLGAVIAGTMAPDPIAQAMNMLREQFSQQINDVRAYVESFVGDSNANNFQQSLLAFQQSVVDCYAQRRVRGAYLFCMRSLEAKFAQTASYLPNQHASIRYVLMFPHSMLFASMYPAIATDFLDALAHNENFVCGRRPNGVDCHEAYQERQIQVGRVVKNIDRIASIIRDKLLPLALTDILPRPFTNNAAVMKAFTYDQHARMVNDYAADGATADRSIMERMTLHQQHGQPLAKDAPYPPKGGLTYADERGNYATFMNPFNRPRVGWERSTATYTFSADAKCEVKGNHYTGYRTRKETCHTFTALLYPSCKYYTAVKPVEESTTRVMQSRLENYYAAGASWAKSNVIDRGNSILAYLAQFRKTLEKPVLSIRKTQDYFDFDNGFPMGTVQQSATIINFQGIAVASISAGGYLEIVLAQTGCADLRDRVVQLSYAASKGGSFMVNTRAFSEKDGVDPTQCRRLEQQSQRFSLPSSEDLTTRKFPLNRDPNSKFSPSLTYSFRFEGDGVRLNTIDIVSIDNTSTATKA